MSLAHTPAGIQTLPVELLLKIFLVACDGDHKLETKTKLAITHTCHHWRDVAIGCGCLWAVIPIPDDTAQTWRRVDESLVRSGVVPLSIIVGRLDSYTFFKNLIAFLEKVLHNTRRLVLPSGAVSLLTSPAPLLETLGIIEDEDREEWEVPENIFDGKAPLLRALDLDSVQIFWDSTLFRNLTYLNLHNVVIETRKPEELLSCLANMPDLEHLSVRHLTLQCDSEDPVPELATKLEFPRLKRLFLAEDVEICSLIFGNLMVRHALEILIVEVSIEPTDEPSNLSKVLAFMSDYHRSLSATTGKLVLMAQVAVNLVHKFISGAGEPLVLLSLHFSSHPPARWIPLFTSELLPLKEVQHVVVDEEITEWMPTYSRMENVQVLRITSNAFDHPMAVFDILEALMKDISRATPEYPSTSPFGVLWPKLNTLVIDGIQFSPIWDHPPSLQGFTVAEALVQCLKVRAGAGFGIMVLDMSVDSQYEIDMETLAGLKESVGKIWINSEHVS